MISGNRLLIDIAITEVFVCFVDDIFYAEEIIFYIFLFFMGNLTIKLLSLFAKTNDLQFVS